MNLMQQALAAQRGGRLDEAERLYRQALALSPSPEGFSNHGNVLSALGRKDEALAAQDKALALRPGYLEALFNRGNIFLELRRGGAALADYDAALAQRPDIAAIWNNRGTALRQLGQRQAALDSYSRAAALQPGHVNAITNCAMMLWEMRCFDEALAAAGRALAVQPGFAEALYVRGNALRDLGRVEEALADYEQALAQNPNHPHVLNGIAHAALLLCDWDRTARLAQLLPQAVAAGRAIQPFVLLGYSEDAALLRRCAENAIQRTAPPRPPLWQGEKYGHDRIRLAYLSADFHQHATAMLMAELFERQDRARFEISAYAFGPDDQSPMRARLEKAFDHFHDVRGKSDAEIAGMLRAAETDIAVDLNGHTLDGRPGIFAHRPAPVQVNYLVYPGTTGAPWMDVVLGDRVVTPMDQQPFFSEKIIHLPDCYQPNDATRLVGPAPDRTEAGLPDDAFVFCCFNNNWKITAPVFDIWMRLLAQVPGSVLWLLDSPATPNLRRAAAARGVDASRLVFAPRLDAAAHLARHRLADLFLDTLPYNAHTTASDALWAGLPLVTCHGKSFQGRVAASLLKFTGLAELVTHRPEDYEALALELARNPALLKATRDKLAVNRKNAPLFDSARFVAGLEDTYAAMLA